MNSFDFIINKSGLKISTINSKRLHSFYDPEKEAIRYFEKVCLQKGITSPEKCQLLIIGESAGYLIRAALHRGFKTLTAITETPIFKNEILTQLKQMTPLPSPAPLIHIVILEEVGRSPLFPNGTQQEKPIVIIPWESAIQNSEAMKTFLVNLPPLLKREIISNKTNRHFARRWITNSFYNFLNIEEYYTLKKVDFPILITAPGSSLTESLPFIQKSRNKFYLLALSSSLQALEKSNITPDLIIQTDGGYWAKQFLARNRDKFVATPITAAPIPNKKIIRISQKTELDRLFLEEDFASFSIDEMGSVACSALHFASQWTTGKIIFAGLDLESDRELAHVKEHLSIDFLKRDENRLNSLSNRLISSYFPVTKGPLSVYNEWFLEFYKNFPNFYRLAPSLSPDLDNLISKEETLALFTEEIPPFQPILIEKLSLKERKAKISSIFESIHQNGSLQDAYFSHIPMEDRQQEFSSFLNSLEKKLKKKDSYE